MSEGRDEPSPVYSLTRVLCWAAPLSAICSAIAGCPYENMDFGPPDPPTSFLVAKALAIGALVLIWAILMWEDRGALAKSSKRS